MRGEKATKPCDNCGQPTTKLLSQVRGSGWFCSRSCAVRTQWQTGNHPRATVANPQRGEKATRPCATCGKPVTRYLSDRRKAQFWTCSRQCMGIENTRRRTEQGNLYLPTKPRRGQTKPCEQCGAPVYRNKSQMAKGEGRYCSAKCHNAAQTRAVVLKACATCGVELRLKPSQAGRRFCSRACMGLGHIKRPLAWMQNGRPAILNGHGYVLVWEPAHPNKSMKGWQYEHRLVMEQAIGRHLGSDEQVDHINQIKNDNRIENLQVLTASEHSRKTGADRKTADELIQIELTEYRRRYGPLE